MFLKKIYHGFFMLICHFLCVSNFMKMIDNANGIMHPPPALVTMLKLPKNASLLVGDQPQPHENTAGEKTV